MARLDCTMLALCFRPEPYLHQFREWDNFRRVYLDEAHSVCWDIDPNVDSNEVWNNKVDLCPDSCYVDSVPFH